MKEKQNRNRKKDKTFIKSKSQHFCLAKTGYSKYDRKI